jgi:hypothetical protein
MTKSNATNTHIPKLIDAPRALTCFLCAVKKESPVARRSRVDQEAFSAIGALPELQYEKRARMSKAVRNGE